ncbi:hypothetical protein D4764_18G0001170 [Takifugu flavidus]|uniref:CCHC-type domain-containing protein n=1 Tax=Takifugu flavidus TaxID=433684 RepID=A0A5C6NRR4_9TELE|nr:hypothetical protein D4764_18G0001170 [Takifugu flavidus]
MNRVVVLFLAKVEQVNMLVEMGMTVGRQFVQVTPLTQPEAQITLSKVPPFISNEFLVHMILNNWAEEFNYRFIVRVDDFDYTLFVTSSALKCFNCGEEGHLARACPSRAATDATVAEPAAATPVAPPAPRPILAVRRRWFGAEGGPAVPDGAVAELHAEEKRGKCVSETEVSGGSENVEMVVEMNGESGEAGRKVDLTGVVCDLSGVMSDVVCDSNELGKMGSELRGQWAQGSEVREQWAQGSKVGTGEGTVSAGEGTSGGSEWWFVPAKRGNKRKSAMKDKGDSKTGRLEDAAAGTDTSDCESMSDCSKLSSTMPDGQDFDLYPPSLFKKFLKQTKGMKGLDLGTYFPDRLRFIRSASFLIRNKATSDLTDPEIYRLKKHMGKVRKQLN